jgi:hypothetical protein
MAGPTGKPAPSRLDLVLYLSGAIRPHRSKGTHAMTRDAFADATIRMISLFGGSESRVAGRQFRGGWACAIFGSGDIDLRAAATADAGATIRIIAIFGSVDLLVPEDWDVNAQTWAVFGDVSAKRSAPASPAGRLTLTGLCLFGGVEVKS